MPDDARTESSSHRAFRDKYRSRRGSKGAFGRCVASGVKDQWLEELRELLKEARACQGKRCPSAGPSIVPGTGAVLGEDRATVENPSDVWGGQDSPVSQGYEADGADDPYIVRRSGDGDPHIAIGQTSPTPMYRRYISKPNVQSVWDRNSGGISTRTQTQAISSRQENRMAFTPGKYVFYLSFRLESPSPFPYTIEQGGASGNANHSQLFQFKSFGGTVKHTFSPPLCGYVGSNGIGISYHDPVDDSKFVRTFHANPGQWVRMAIVADWSRDGWYEVWADVDQNGTSTNGVMQRVISRQDGGDGLDFFGADRTQSMWGIGLYYNMALLDGSRSGLPHQDEIHTDYANAQITRYQG